MKMHGQLTQFYLAAADTVSIYTHNAALILKMGMAPKH